LRNANPSVGLRYFWGVKGFAAPITGRGEQFQSATEVILGSRLRLRFVVSSDISRSKSAYAASGASSIGSTIEGSSFSGLLTRVEIGHICMSPAGNGHIKSHGVGLVAQPASIVAGRQDRRHPIMDDPFTRCWLFPVLRPWPPCTVRNKPPSAIALRSSSLVQCEGVRPKNRNNNVLSMV
jgi:hypothetical protein